MAVAVAAILSCSEAPAEQAQQMADPPRADAPEPVPAGAFAVDSQTDLDGLAPAQRHLFDVWLAMRQGAGHDPLDPIAGWNVRFVPRLLGWLPDVPVFMAHADLDGGHDVIRPRWLLRPDARWRVLTPHRGVTQADDSGLRPTATDLVACTPDAHLQVQALFGRDPGSKPPADPVATIEAIYQAQCSSLGARWRDAVRTTDEAAIQAAIGDLVYLTLGADTAAPITRAQAGKLPNVRWRREDGWLAAGLDRTAEEIRVRGVWNAKATYLSLLVAVDARVRAGSFEASLETIGGVRFEIE